MEGKKWYTSWTLWFNGLVAGAVAFCQAIGHPIPAEYVGSLMTLGTAIINLILRFKTKEPVTT